MNVEQVENSIKTAGIGGAGILGTGAVTQESVIAIVGVVVLVLTFITNLVFRFMDNRRKNAMHEIEMKLKRKELEE